MVDGKHDEEHNEEHNEQRDEQRDEEHDEEQVGFCDYWCADEEGLKLPLQAASGFEPEAAASAASQIATARDLRTQNRELRKLKTSETMTLQTSEKMEASALLGLEEKLLSDFCLQNELTSEFLTQFDPLSKPKL